MTEGVLIDNDVIIKVSAYDLAAEILSTTEIENTPPAMLGVGRFVVQDRLSRGRWLVEPERARASFDRLLAKIILLEPNEAELSAAAELEAAATRLDLDLDGGESQLLAVLIARGSRLLLTGDKRAVRAIAQVAAADTEGRIASLEQLIAHLMRHSDLTELRARVCSEPGADRTLSICFGCNREAAPAIEEVRAGLSSYLRHLRGEAPGCLLVSDDLGALAA